MSAVGVDGSVDPLLVRPTWVPRTRAPHQVSEVGEARSARISGHMAGVLSSHPRGRLKALT
jgi:hypothetical protein